MKILLVYPKYPDTFWGFKHALKFISKKANFPPMGLLTVAAMLPKKWEKKLIDMTVTSLKDKDIQWADYVFISAMSVQQESVKDVITKCKKLKAKIVAGGPLFSTAYEVYKDVDHLVLNEAEVTLPPFLKDLEEGHPKHVYMTDEKPNISYTPIPLWELADMRKYAIMSIQASRGCPFNCDFCDVTRLLGRKIRMKIKDRIIDELDRLYELGWRAGVFFVDDNFIGNKKMVRNEILPALIDWMEEKKHPFVFSTQASVNIADEEDIMKMMVQAGFHSVFVGIETPHEASLAECGKLQNRNRDMIASVQKIQKFGLEVTGGFIIGFDSDPSTIFDSMISFIQKSGIVTAMVGLLNAPTGTRLYERLLKENRIIQKYIGGNNTDLSINFIPKMKYEDLVEGYKKVLRTIYSPKLYYERIRTLMKNFNPLRKNKYKFKLAHVWGAVKSTWFLGIKEKSRVYYWKLMFWSLFKRPRLLPLALTYAVYGFHFRKIFGSY